MYTVERLESEFINSEHQTAMDDCFSQSRPDSQKKCIYSFFLVDFIESFE